MADHNVTVEPDDGVIDAGLPEVFGELLAPIHRLGLPSFRQPASSSELALRNHQAVGMQKSLRLTTLAKPREAHTSS